MSRESYFSMIIWDEAIGLRNVLPVLLITFDNSIHVLQVYSKSVGDTLETFRYAQATRNFIYLVDTLFDCLNVTSKLLGQMKRKDALKPYYDENDWRFQVHVSITIYCLIWNVFITLQQLYYTLAPRNGHL